MKWSVFVCVALCLLRHGEGGALKCIPGSQDRSCSSDPEEKEPQIQTSTDDSPEDKSFELECLPGSEWESNCHSCRCSESGRTRCQKNDVCESDTLDEPIRCKPHTSFQKGCKTCICTEVGQVLCSSCTSSSSIPKKSELPLGKDCLPGSTWKSQCNNCMCSEEGYAECTKMGCPGRESEPTMRCAPNTVWKNECNTCWCTAEGNVICTRVECVTYSLTTDSIPKKSELALGKDCLPGSTWESQCNTCTCSESGYAECTEMACPGRESEPIMGCAPNTTWKNECNTCWCTANGNAMCTRVECVTYTGSIPKKSELALGKDCLPGSTWKSQCNNCMCSEGGYAECTKMGCPGRESEPIMGCAPNTTWKNECNTCWCTANGNAMCTRVECVTYTDLGSEQAESVIKEESLIPQSDNEIDADLNIIDNGVHGYHTIFKRSLCRPNEEFKADCNTCKCSPTGGSYKCTQNECMEEDILKEVEVFSEGPGVDHVEKQTVCKPLALFHISCNTCRCNYDGTDYSCTENSCPIPKDVELIRELKIIRSSLNTNKSVVCVANRMFIKDCNTCWCNEDGTSYFCTRRVCVEENPDEIGGELGSENLRIIKKQCRPNEVFELDCNMCRCNPDGQSYSCTRRACIEMPGDEKNFTLSRKTRASQQDAPKACQPGQEFRMDCNKCLCDNEGQDFSCTRIDCNAANNPHTAALTQTRSKREASEKVSGSCTPGEVFTRGCNVCRCSTDGHVAVCTIKNCRKDNDNENGHQATDLDPSFRCNAGEQYKQDCNDCTCSADGKSVFCTLRYCDNNLTPDI